MEKKKFIPFAKRSKKEQKKENAKHRGSWNGVNPATRVQMSDKKRKIADEVMREMRNERF